MEELEKNPFEMCNKGSRLIKKLKKFHETSALWARFSEPEQMEDFSANNFLLYVEFI